jgi:hypothetical protein
VDINNIVEKIHGMNPLKMHYRGGLVTECISEHRPHPLHVDPSAPFGPGMDVVLVETKMQWRGGCQHC